MLDLLVIGDCNPDVLVVGDNVVPAFGQQEKLVESISLVVGDRRRSRRSLPPDSG